MPRPQKYVRRIDTKVRLRLDHREALDQVVEATPGLSRNALIEQILDAHFKLKAPRLTKMPADPKVQRSAQEANARTSPRLRRVGEEQAEAQGDTDTPPVIPPKTAKPSPGPAPGTERRGGRGPVKPRSRR